MHCRRVTKRLMCLNPDPIKVDAGIRKIGHAFWHSLGTIVEYRERQWKAIDYRNLFIGYLVIGNKLGAFSVSQGNIFPTKTMNDDVPYYPSSRLFIIQTNLI